MIGLDIGGTKTRGIKVIGGEVVDDREAGSANVQNVTPEVAAANLAELFTALGGADAATVYVGAGGIDTEADADALAQLIRPHAPHAEITVVHDSRLLLAAGRARTGVAVIAGTGTAAWGTNDDGEEARAGGWGYLLGDEGSGYWLAREATRYSLHRMNLGLEPDALTQALLEAVGLDAPRELIAHFHSPSTGRRYWAQQARVVVEAADAGHAGARFMIDQASHDLARMAAQVARQLGIDGPVILGSGLGMNVRRLQDGFRAALAEQGIEDVRILDRDPVFGTIDLASRRS
ncbi:BadF/BadG/BcrA/BcrD ATPase family protein [Sinomonas sp. JGH33]|uniref:BadF/BadG/BcrA/BcrD ATPase family protein n=1 Tax=Sinomonas terricola TaxID=3110330 RepID=A0ABU5T102_9MICC|nr:BadF/BadG/BcrA/BcrD ATPase family protein [Sinomonas sp. JGH33]MEA5453323.1 BadF/BadG/BcrA/BcrD ATPase family protein [Sinomonas sp. JGH33]